MSLPSAIEKVRDIHKAEGQNSVDRETIARLIGFGGINGASAAALSALAKYGLLESVEGKESRVTDLAVKILFPHSEEEKRAAIREASELPTLFRDIKEKWPERPPSADNLRSYLARSGFNQGSLDQVIQIYRDTIDIVEPNEGGYNAGVKPKEPPVTPNHSANQPPPPPPAPSRPFTVNFDGKLLSGSISITSARDIDRLVKVLQAQKAAFEAMADDIGDEWGDEDASKTEPAPN